MYGHRVDGVLYVGVEKVTGTDNRRVILFAWVGNLHVHGRQ